MALGDGEAHVWLVDLDAGGVEVELLSAAERARAERFHRPGDRARYIVCHAAKRRILSLYTGREAASLQFVHGPDGKPALEGGMPRFSLAHSGGRALFAVTREIEIGVDLEVGSRRVGEALPIARRWFTVEEYAALAALQEPERSREFLRCWTRLEAFGKGVGCGVIKAVGMPRGQWRMQAVDVGAEYVAALASERAVRVVKRGLEFR